MSIRIHAALPDPPVPQGFIPATGFAAQYDGSNAVEIAAEFGANSAFAYEADGPHLIVRNMDTQAKYPVNEGEWVVRLDDGYLTRANESYFRRHFCEA